MKGRMSKYTWHGELSFLDSDTLILPPMDWKKTKEKPHL